jgi:hypothetical protein
MSNKQIKSPTIKVREITQNIEPSLEIIDGKINLTHLEKLFEFNNRSLTNNHSKIRYIKDKYQSEDLYCCKNFVMTTTHKEFFNEYLDYFSNYIGSIHLTTLKSMYELYEQVSDTIKNNTYTYQELNKLVLDKKSNLNCCSGYSTQDKKNTENKVKIIQCFEKNDVIPQIIQQTDKNKNKSLELQYNTNTENCSIFINYKDFDRSEINLDSVNYLMSYLKEIDIEFLTNRPATVVVSDNYITDSEIVNSPIDTLESKLKELIDKRNLAVTNFETSQASTNSINLQISDKEHQIKYAKDTLARLEGELIALENVKQLETSDDNNIESDIQELNNSIDKLTQDILTIKHIFKTNNLN